MAKTGKQIKIAAIAKDIDRANFDLIFRAWEEGVLNDAEIISKLIFKFEYLLNRAKRAKEA